MKIDLVAKDYKELYSHGLPRNITNNEPFELNNFVRSFTSVTKHLKPQRCSELKQHKFFKKVLDNPFFGPYTYCISGNPSDSYVKMLAALIMLKAYKLHSKKQTTKAPPKWINLYMNFDNPALQPGFRPSLLILNNVTIDSSNSKVDKLRDCLEYHAAVPKIVLVSGCDPITFFNTRLYTSLNGALYIQGNQIKVEQL